MQSRLFPSKSINKTINWNNVPSTKSTLSPPSLPANTLSNTRITFKPEITTILFISIVTGATFMTSSKNKEPFPRKKRSKHFDSSYKPSKYSTNTTLCIETSNHKTFFSVMEKSNWEILDFARGLNLENIWPRRC